MKNNYTLPDYLSIPLISNKTGISRTEIGIDIRSGKINKFQIEISKIKMRPAAKSRIMRSILQINNYLRDHIYDGPEFFIANFSPYYIEPNSSYLGTLNDNINSNTLFDNWLKAYNIDIDYIKLVIPRDEVIKYLKYKTNKSSDATCLDNNTFDSIEYITNKRKEIGCNKNDCTKCKSIECRNKIAYDFFTEHGMKTSDRVPLIDIGIAMRGSDLHNLNLRKNLKASVHKWKKAHKQKVTKSHPVVTL